MLVDRGPSHGTHRCSGHCHGWRESQRECGCMSCPPEGVREWGSETVRYQEREREVEEDSKGKRGILTWSKT